MRLFRNIIWVFSIIINQMLFSGEWCETPTPENDFLDSIGIEEYTSEHPAKNINLFFHIIKPTVGSGGFSNSQVNALFTILNDDFESGNISFTEVGRNTIKNSTYYNNPNLTTLRQPFGHSNALDIFLVPGAIGDAGSIISHSVIVGLDFAGTSVLSHEVGHSFSLYHTHDTGFGAEYGHDCNTTGDLVCDTPPDPNLHHGAYVDNNCDNIPHIDIDPDSGIQDPYNPDTHNIESYTDLSRLDWFTDGQFDRIHTNFIHSAIMDAYVEKIVVPQNLSWTNSSNHPRLSWNAVSDPDLDGYLIYRNILGESIKCDQFQLHATLSSSQTTYTDQSIDVVHPRIALNQAEYYVVAINTDDDKSFHSNIISVPTNTSAKQLVATEFWETAGPLNYPRVDHVATKLLDGSVLVTGGSSLIDDHSLNSCEVYDVEDNSWNTTVSLAEGRSGHTSTLLNDGNVLIIGGITSSSSIESCEIYNPTTSSWAYINPLVESRESHASVLLRDGRVLVIGGFNLYPAGEESLSSCEIYNPMTGEWRQAAPLNHSRGNHKAILLDNGNVIVIGGQKLWGDPILMTEIYDPAFDSWSDVDDLNFPRSNFSTTKLENGDILVVGGDSDTCEIFDHQLNYWKVTTPVLFPRTSGIRSVLLENGKVLLTGGRIECELFDPAEARWTQIQDLPSIRFNHTLTELENGGALLAGGSSDSTCYIYYPDTVLVSTQPNSFIPYNYLLKQNYPNPFNPVTTIQYELPQRSNVQVTIYNLLGREVTALISETQEAGIRSVIWNAMDNHGEPVSAGVYLYQIQALQKEGGQAGEFVQTKKMVLMK